MLGEEVLYRNPHPAFIVHPDGRLVEQSRSAPPLFALESRVGAVRVCCARFLEWVCVRHRYALRAEGRSTVFGARHAESVDCGQDVTARFGDGVGSPTFGEKRTV